MIDPTQDSPVIEAAVEADLPPLRDAVKVDGERIRGHLDEMVRGTVEQTLNALLDAEADELCGAKRYERNPGRLDTRADSYPRKLPPEARDQGRQGHPGSAQAPQVAL